MIDHSTDVINEIQDLTNILDEGSTNLKESHHVEENVKMDVNTGSL